MHINKLANSLELEINSSLKSVADAAIEISAFCRQHKMDDTACFQLELCAVEAINNAIIHAYNNKPGKLVNINCSVENNLVTIKVSDTGKTMNQPIPTHLTATENDSGRGWFIMQQWTDSVEYLANNGVNTVVLKKYRNYSS